MEEQVRRVVVLGVSGSGKSTVAARLSIWLNAPHVELDALYHGPNWTPPVPDDFRSAIVDVARSDAWVIDGNYVDTAAPLAWQRANLVIWLDLPLILTMSRVLRRSVSRALRKTELWNGNRESLRSLLGRNSLLVGIYTAHHRYRSEYPKLLQSRLADGSAIHVTSKRAVDDLLANPGSVLNYRREARGR
jgi:adenylate kinase family enzyme